MNRSTALIFALLIITLYTPVFAWAEPLVEPIKDSKEKEYQKALLHIAPLTLNTIGLQLTPYKNGILGGTSLKKNLYTWKAPLHLLIFREAISAEYDDAWEILEKVKRNTKQEDANAASLSASTKKDQPPLIMSTDDRARSFAAWFITEGVLALPALDERSARFLDFLDNDYRDSLGKTMAGSINNQHAIVSRSLIQKPLQRILAHQWHPKLIEAFEFNVLKELTTRTGIDYKSLSLLKNWSTSPQSKVILSTLQAYGPINPYAGTGALWTTMNEKNQTCDVRLWSQKAFGSFHEAPEAWIGIAGYFQNSAMNRNRNDRCLSEETLIETYFALGGELGIKEISQWLSKQKSPWSHAITMRAVQALFYWINHPGSSHQSRQQASLELVTIYNNKTITPLPPQIKTDIEESLIAYPIYAAHPILSKILHHKNKEKRIRTIKSISQIDNSVVVKYLLEQMKEEKNDDVRKVLWEALAHYPHSEKVRDHAFKALVEKKSQPQWLLNLIQGILLKNPSESVERLLVHARDQDPTLRHRAQQILANHGTASAFDLFLSSKSPETQMPLIITYLEHATHDVLPYLLSLLSENGEDGRLTTILPFLEAARHRLSLQKKCARSLVTQLTKDVHTLLWGIRILGKAVCPLLMTELIKAANKEDSLAEELEARAQQYPENMTLQKALYSHRNAKSQKALKAAPPILKNPHQKDTDNDGLHDEIEKDLGLNPLSPDTDNDRMKDAYDRAPHVPLYAKMPHHDKQSALLGAVSDAVGSYKNALIFVTLPGDVEPSSRGFSQNNRLIFNSNSKKDRPHSASLASQWENTVHDIRVIFLNTKKDYAAVWYTHSIYNPPKEYPQSASIPGQKNIIQTTLERACRKCLWVRQGKSTVLPENISKKIMRAQKNL